MERWEKEFAETYRRAAERKRVPEKIMEETKKRIQQLEEEREKLCRNKKS